MPDTTKETFGGEIAKQLPVKDIYTDLAHPTLSTIGQTLQGATRIALAPVTALIWGYDKIADYLDVAIPEYFAKRKIKKENITTPDPAIAVPLIGAMCYTSHKPELREMFTNLLLFMTSIQCSLKSLSSYVQMNAKCWHIFTMTPKWLC